MVLLFALHLDLMFTAYLILEDSKAIFVTCTIRISNFFFHLSNFHLPQSIKFSLKLNYTKHDVGGV